MITSDPISTQRPPAKVRYRFAQFLLDPLNRTLESAGVAVPLNARYFDALCLLVGQHGQLVEKQSFFDTVWGDTVVSDSALTQAIKEIRRVFGDDANHPRFVRTVPGHGYCFIADVEPLLRPAPSDPASKGALDSSSPASSPASSSPASTAPDSISEEATLPGVAEAENRSNRLGPSTTAGSARAPRWLLEGAAASVGGAVAGMVGGLLYGSMLALSPSGESLGSLSILLVLLALSMLVGVAGAMGVGLGLAIGRSMGGRWLAVGGATVGGLLVGGLAKLLGSDAFALLIGHAPVGITGALEGGVIGLAIGLGLVLGGGIDAVDSRWPVATSAAATGLAGALIALAGGSMMATSLARVVATFDQSRLDVAPLGDWLGEPQFGTLAQTLLGALEGSVFGACVVGALLISRHFTRQR